MAQILVKALDSHHVDPIVDKRGCYKFGDPVVVTDDDHKWGSAECIPQFLILKCTDTTLDDIRHLLDPLTTQTQELDADSNPLPPETLTRKRYQFDFSLLPEQYHTELFACGSVELPYYVLETAIVYKD